MNIETLLARPTLRGLEFRLGFEAFAHKTASALGLAGVQVVWSKGIMTAGINTFGELFLSDVRDDSFVTRASIVRYAGYVVHELLHHKYTDFRQNASLAYVRTLHNAIEDGWIESTGIGSNLLGNIGRLLGELIDTMTREALAEVTDWNDPRQYPYILAVHCRPHATVKCPTNPALLPIFDEAARRCALATSSADTLQIARWVYEKLHLASQTPPPKDDQAGDSEQAGDADGDQAGDAGDGDGKGEQAGDAGAGGEGGEDASKTGEKAPTGDDQGSGEGKVASPEKNAPSQPIADPATVRKAREVEPSLGEELGAESTGGSFSKDQNIQHGDLHVAPIQTLTKLGVVAVPAKLRFEVKRLFDDTGLSDFRRNRKAGSINVHALPSVAHGNDRVFKRRLDVEGVDSAVVICLDVSGSMFGNRQLIVSAVQACRVLMETLAAAGVKTALMTFGSSVALLKPFETNHKVASAKLGCLRHGSKTNDYAALRYAHEILARRSEQRKVVFVMTDGVGDAESTHIQCGVGVNLGITTIGIGIQHDVSHVYPQSIMVNDMSDLGNASFKQIKLAA